MLPRTSVQNYHSVCIVYMYVCMYVCRFQNIVLRCPTPRLHCFLSSHWPSFRFLLFMAFLIPSIQLFFGLPHALFVSASISMLFWVIFLLPFLSRFFSICFFSRVMGCWPINPTPNLEDQCITILHCIKFQKSAGLMYMVTEACVVVQMTKMRNCVSSSVIDA